MAATLHESLTGMGAAIADSILLRALRTAAWFNAGRVIAYGRVLLVCEIALFIFLAAGTHGLIVPLDQPTSTDFVSFYAAGQLANAGTPALAYDQAAHYAAEQQATETGISYNFFFYPPPMLLLSSVLALLPYLLSYVLFQVLCIAGLVWVARQTLQLRGWAWVAVLLASPAGFYAIGLGQNSFLSATLFGGALLLVDRRPWLAGLLFGLLCYKPHFGLLIPVALLAGQHFRAAAAATLTVLAVVGLTLLLYGSGTWLAFLDSFAHSPSIYQSGRITLAGFVTVFGSALLVGLPPAAAYAVQAAAALASAGLVAWVWGRQSSIELRAAALLAGTFLAVPLALVYDLTIVVAGGLWLIRAGLRGGFLPWEKVLLLVAFLVPLASRSAALSLHVPLGVLGSAIPMALCLRRVLAERRARIA